MKTTVKQINVGHRCAGCGSRYNEVDEYLYTHKELRGTGHKQHTARNYSIEIVTENCDYCSASADRPVETSRSPPDGDKTEWQRPPLRTDPMTWKDRYDAMKRHYAYTDADIASITGHTPAAVRQLVTSKQREFPRWLRLAIVNFETEHYVSTDIPPGNPAN